MFLYTRTLCIKNNKYNKCQKKNIRWVNLFGSGKFILICKLFLNLYLLIVLSVYHLYLFVMQRYVWRSKISKRLWIKIYISVAVCNNLNCYHHSYCNKFLEQNHLKKYISLKNTEILFVNGQYIKVNVLVWQQLGEIPPMVLL